MEYLVSKTASNFFTLLAFSSNIAKFFGSGGDTILKSPTLGVTGETRGNPETSFLALAREAVMQFKKFS